MRKGISADKDADSRKTNPIEKEIEQRRRADLLAQRDAERAGKVRGPEDERDLNTAMLFLKHRSACRRLVAREGLLGAAQAKINKMTKANIPLESVRAVPFTSYGLVGQGLTKAGNGPFLPWDIPPSGEEDAEMRKELFKPPGKSPGDHLRTSCRRQMSVHFLRYRARAVMLASRRYQRWPSKAERIHAGNADAAWVEE